MTSSASTPRACVMGYPVAHSRSPMIHGYWLNALGIDGGYDLAELTPAEFPDFFTRLADHGYVGGNITVPHKEAAFRLVDRRDKGAQSVGAVNTVWLENGELVGGNSDVYGFLANLDASIPGWDRSGDCAVILGAGGAARSAAYGLMQRGYGVRLVNRTLQRALDLAAHFGSGTRGFEFSELPKLLPEANLLINCTSLGMAGKESLTFDLRGLKRSAIVYDVVYVPLETPLLASAHARGNRTIDGLGMLLQQAGFGFEKWFGAKPTVTPELRALVEADIRTKTPK